MHHTSEAPSHPDLTLDQLPATRQDYIYEELVREVIPLTAEDMKSLELFGPSKSQSGLKHLRAYHHHIALRLAAGDKAVDICAALSLTPQTITRLQKSSQFRELVGSYRNKFVNKAVDTYELMTLVSAEALTALHERLISEDRDEIPLEMLRRLFVDAADRTGNSPIRRSETLSRHQHELTSETLERIRRLHGEDTTYTASPIDAEFEVHEEESAGAGAAKSIAGAFLPLPKEKVEGSLRSGNGVPAKSFPLPPERTLTSPEGQET